MGSKRPPNAAEGINGLGVINDWRRYAGWLAGGGDIRSQLPSCQKPRPPTSFSAVHRGIREKPNACSARARARVRTCLAHLRDGLGGRRRGHFCSTNNYFDRINYASLGDGFREGEGRQRIRARVCEEGGALPATKGMSRILKRYKERKMGKRRTVC